LPPPGQADISPFIENLLQTASAAPSPYSEGLCQQLLPNPCHQSSFVSFSPHQAFYFSYHQHDFSVILDLQMPAPKITM